MNIGLLQDVVAELTAKITSARIVKIYQPTADLFIFRLWNGQENLKLLISAAPQESRIHLTGQSFPNPFTPPRFCQLLRSRLSRITEIRQVNEDRIVEIDCQGPKGACRLVIELTGRSCNLILLAEDGRIIDSLNRQTSEHGRILLAGKIYAYPTKRTQLDKSKSRVKLSDNESASATVEKFYREERSAENSADLKSRLLKLIAKEQKKLLRRLKNIEQELMRQQDFEHYRQFGELLLANLHQFNRGMSEVLVVNYYLQPPVETAIPLNPVLGPQQNAEKYFQKYKKARRGVEHSARRKAETDNDLAWLAQLDYQLMGPSDPADVAAVAAVAAELKKAGVLKDKIGRLPRLNNAKKTVFQEALSPNGFKVLWGTNSRQNDVLSSKELKNGDLWFHAHRCPGSHVVLKADSGRAAFTDDDSAFAAAIAAAHSKAKEDHKVEVMVAAAKDVKKPVGAKPGIVSVKHYKTLVVRPYVGGTDVF